MKSSLANFHQKLHHKSPKGALPHPWPQSLLFVPLPQKSGCFTSDPSKATSPAPSALQAWLKCLHHLAYKTARQIYFRYIKLFGKVKMYKLECLSQKVLPFLDEDTILRLLLTKKPVFTQPVDIFKACTPPSCLNFFFKLSDIQMTQVHQKISLHIQVKNTFLYFSPYCITAECFI